MQRFSPRGEGSESHIRFPSPAVLHQEDESPECLTLKISRAYVEDSQSTVGNRDSNFKRRTLWGPSADQTCLLVLEAGGNWCLPWDTDTGVCGHWCWQVAVWNPPSSFTVPGDLIPPTSLLALVLGHLSVQEKRASEDKMAGWHHRCNEYELGQALGDGEG